MIKDSVLKIYRNKIANIIPTDKKAMLKHDRKLLTGKLAKCFDEVVSCGNCQN